MYIKALSMVILVFSFWSLRGKEKAESPWWKKIFTFSWPAKKQDPSAVLYKSDYICTDEKCTPVNNSEAALPQDLIPIPTISKMPIPGTIPPPPPPPAPPPPPPPPAPKKISEKKKTHIKTKQEEPKTMVNSQPSMMDELTKKLANRTKPTEVVINRNTDQAKNENKTNLANRIMLRRSAIAGKDDEEDDDNDNINKVEASSSPKKLKAAANRLSFQLDNETLTRFSIRINEIIAELEKVLGNKEYKIDVISALEHARDVVSNNNKTRVLLAKYIEEKNREIPKIKNLLISPNKLLIETDTISSIENNETMEANLKNVIQNFEEAADKITSAAKNIPLKPEEDKMLHLNLLILAMQLKNFAFTKKQEMVNLKYQVALIKQLTKD